MKSEPSPRKETARERGGIVRDWYDTKKNVDEMKHWREGKLKIWEQAVVSYFPRGARVPDIGCGMGREAFALKDDGYAVTGIDLSGEVIAQVSRLSAEQGRTIPFSIMTDIIRPLRTRPLTS